MPCEDVFVDWQMVILCPATGFASAADADADVDDVVAVVADDIVAVIRCYPTSIRRRYFARYAHFYRTIDFPIW